MKKYMADVFLFIIVGVFFSCATPAPIDRQPIVPWGAPDIRPNENESVLIVRRTTAYAGGVNWPIWVTINGQNRILGTDSEEGKIIIPNGHHLIRVQPRNSAGRRELHLNANSEQIIVLFTLGRGTGDNSIAILNRENLSVRATGVTTGIEGALIMAAEEVAENFTARSRIAIVYISTEDRGTTDFITGELEHLLLRQGFIIVDRAELDRIRAEQQFGLFGEVDDNTAARIGHFAGASVVITGGVDGEGALRRLRLRALDTTTGQVVGTASERM